MNFATIDIVFASLALILVIRCALRGFVEEFMSMAAVVIGVLAAILLYKPGADYLRGQFGVNTLPEVVAFAALFVLGFLIVKLLEHIIRDIVQRIHLGTVDRLLGLVLGAVEALLVVSVVLFVLSVQPLFDPSALLEGSIFARYLLPLVSEVGRSASTVGA